MKSSQSRRNHLARPSIERFPALFDRYGSAGVETEPAARPPTMASARRERRNSDSGDAHVGCWMSRCSSSSIVIRNMYVYNCTYTHTHIYIYISHTHTHIYIHIIYIYCIDTIYYIHDSIPESLDV